MDSPLDVIDLFIELLIWLGFILGGLCFLALLIMRAARGGWIETEAVLVEGDPNGTVAPTSDASSTSVRWMTEDGVLYSAVLHPDDIDEARDPETLRVFYSRRAPHRFRMNAAPHGEKVLLVLGIVLVGAGALATIVSIVLLFV